MPDRANSLDAAKEPSPQEQEPLAVGEVAFRFDDGAVEESGKGRKAHVRGDARLGEGEHKFEVGFDIAEDGKAPALRISRRLFAGTSPPKKEMGKSGEHSNTPDQCQEEQTGGGAH